MKQNNPKKSPVRLSRFWILTIVLPLVIAGLLVALAYSGTLGRGVTGPYAGLAAAMIARYVIYAAYGAIFIIGLLGIIYTFLKARHDWRYYALSLTLPVLLIGWLLFGALQQQAQESNPDYKRYLSNISTCSDILVEGSSAKYQLPSETYTSIDTSKLNLREYDDRINTLYDAEGPLWKNGGVCADEYMTEAEEAELDIYMIKHQELQKELRLLDVLNLESQGGRAACDYVRSNAEIELTLPTAATNEGEVCAVLWLSWEHGGDYISTLDLLHSL